MRTMVVGTRGSRLALAQTNWVIAELRGAHADLDVRIETISTRGDQRPDVPLAQVGQKGIFTKELETALLERRIDLAVHSAKDLPVPTPAGLAILCVPTREDARDALIEGSGFRVQGSGPKDSPGRGSGAGATSDGDASSPLSPLAMLPAGALIGTSSLRRQAQLALARPDLRFAPLRGNVETRIAKVRRGECDGTVLAMAGLRRAGLAHEAAGVLDLEVMLPAPGQGVLALEGRSDDRELARLLSPLHDPQAELALRCERAVVEALGATCLTPIAALAEIQAGRLRVRTVVAAPDGSAVARAHVEGSADQFDKAVQQALKQLEDQGALKIIAACR